MIRHKEEVYENEHTREQARMAGKLGLSSSSPTVTTQSTNKYVNGQDRFGRPIVDCRVCGIQTRHVQTRLCDQCHELDAAIRRNLDAAEKIVTFYKSKHDAQKKRTR